MGTAGAGPKRSSPLQEILLWSESRPKWQRDALRRIVTKGSLDAADLDELERIATGGLQNPLVRLAPLTAQPLSDSHLPPAPDSAESVSLVELRDLRNVNRIPDGSVLPLGSGSGLVVIYGENGAGKSGFARVIKGACRARGGSRPVVPNAFAAPPGGSRASATIGFKAGGAPAQCAWTDGLPGDPRLANVFVFDAECAEHYVGRDDATAFTPFGLDVLPKLANACDDIRSRLERRAAELRSAMDAARAEWRCEPDTRVGALVRGLNAGTDEAEVDALARLDAKEQSRIQALRGVLASDPLLTAKGTRAAQGRVEAFLARLRHASELLSDGALADAERCLRHAVESADAAAKFAAGAFDGSFLSGTGSDLWKRLWEAAREFAVREAFPSQGFPPTIDGSRCVLCQQGLGGAALERFAEFDAFLKDRSQEISAEAERSLADLLGRYRAAPPLSAGVAEIAAESSALSPTRLAVLSAFASGVDEGLRRVRENLESRTWAAPAPLPASPEPDLSAAVAALERGAVAQEAASDPGARVKLEAELKELLAREWLSGARDGVLAQIGHHGALRELDGIAERFHTAAITVKSNELSETFVTAAYRERFREEVRSLGLATLDVRLDAVQGTKGVTRFGLRLSGVPSSGIARIASEGEKRCAALAAFLAELALASHKSALVFDDPVSSLDHTHREKLAERLVEEARGRQVIVFTHDVVFLADLRRSAGAAEQEPALFTVEWSGDAPGSHRVGLAWDLRDPAKCLDALSERQRRIAGNWNAKPNEEDVAAMRDAYTLFRSVVERIVEKEMLAGVVERFSEQVNAGRLQKLVGISRGECDDAARLIKKCHRVTGGHAPSMNAVPTPEELRLDLVACRSLREKIRGRRQTGIP